MIVFATSCTGGSDSIPMGRKKFLKMPHTMMRPSRVMAVTTNIS
jgi:hypothetical protein